MRSDLRGTVSDAGRDAFELSFAHPSLAFSSHKASRRSVYVGYHTTFLLTPIVLVAGDDLRCMSPGREKGGAGGGGGAEMIEKKTTS